MKMLKNKYNFDKISNRKIDHARKWDREILSNKFTSIPKDYIPMWIADMDFQVAPEITEEFNKLVQNGSYGYTYAYDEFYQAVKDWQFRKHDSLIKKEWITLSYGTVSTIHYLYQAFCRSEDSVLINTPVYDPFSYAAKHNGINIISNELTIGKDGKYKIDYDILEKQIKEKHPKLYLLCSPHNPSGRVWTKEELYKIAKLCYENDVILVCDEVHSEMILYGSHFSALKLPNKYQENLIVLSSPNKGFNLGGLKTSYSIIPNFQLRQIFRERLQRNSITSPNIFGIVGMTTAYTRGDAWLNELIDYLKDNYEYATKFIDEQLKNWEPMPMDASYLLWIKISKTGMSSNDFVKDLAQKTGVILDPETNYASNEENYVRLNLGTSQKLVKEALLRIKSYYDHQNKNQ